MTSSPPALTAIRVEKAYAGTTALAGASLEVAAGSTLALVGESGSGKSTLLRMFNRTVEPDRGQVLVGERPVAALDPIDLRRRIGYVAQRGGLLPHWTVARNVELVPALLGWNRARRARRAEAMLELVGLEAGRFRERYPRQLSGGERQRVALARALAADPPVVLLDEPFGALDALTRRRLQREFAALEAGLQKTVLLVTHDLDEAFRLADTVAVMYRGEVVQQAPPDVLVKAPATPYVRRLLELRGGGVEPPS